jgi:drug/metabolite transporter (DMT)-like permease
MLMIARLFSAYALLVLAPLFWSGNFVVARGVHEIVPPAALAFWRWAAALLIFLPFIARRLVAKRHLLLRHWKVLSLLGLLSVTNFSFCIYQALHATTVVNAALINSFYPVLIVIISWSGFRDRISVRQAVGVFASLAGLLWILSRGRPGLLLDLRFSAGDLWTLAAGVNWALYSVLLRRRPAGLDHLVFLGGLMICGTLFLVPLYGWELIATGGFAVSGRALGSIAYVAVFPSILAYLCWNIGVERVGANRAGIFVHLIPVFSILLALVLLGERLRAYHLPGMGLIFAGIYLTTARRLPSHRRPAAGNSP